MWKFDVPGVWLHLGFVLRGMVGLMGGQDYQEGKENR